MNASKFFLKAANSLVTAVVALFLILAAAYSGYALWDNAQVYGAVDDIQSQLLKLKPDPEQKDGGASFEELRKINPDVCGWITLDHTKIDYPILRERVCQDDFCKFSKFKYLSAEKSPNISCLHIS